MLWVRCVSTGNGQTSWCSSEENSEMVLWSLAMNDCRIHAAHRTALLDYILGYVGYMSSILTKVNRKALPEHVFLQQSRLGFHLA